MTVNHNNPERMIVPEFSSEAEEAAWWDSNRDWIAQRFVEAAERGELGHGRVAKLAAGTKSGPSPTLTIRVPESDISKARIFAERKGLRYQTYLRMLIHEGLLREEQRVE